MAEYLQDNFSFDRLSPFTATKLLLMHIHLFENLNFNSRACITWKEGVHIGYRCEGNYYMALYRLNDFYVEVQYHTCFDGIAAIRSFQCEDELEQYLNKIDITTIFA